MGNQDVITFQNFLLLNWFGFSVTLQNFEDRFSHSKMYFLNYNFIFLVNKLSRQKKPHNCPQLVLAEPRGLLIHREPLKILTFGFVPCSRALVSNRVIPTGSGQGTPHPPLSLEEGLAPGVGVKGWKVPRNTEENAAFSRDLVGWD